MRAPMMQRAKGLRTAAKFAFVIIFCLALFLSPVRVFASAVSQPAHCLRPEAGLLPFAAGTLKASETEKVSKSEKSDKSGKTESTSETDNSGKKKPAFSIPDNVHFDAEAEKKKLAEAIATLDEMGLSPEKVFERFWGFISRKENREKVGETFENFKEKTGKMIKKSSPEKTEDGSGSAVQKDSNRSQGGTAGGGIIGEAERVREKVEEEVSEKMNEAAGRASEEAGKAVSREIDRISGEAGETVTGRQTD